MPDNVKKGKLLLEANAICGICERRIRFHEKVETLDEAEKKLREADWVKNANYGWVCFVCKLRPEKEE